MSDELRVTRKNVSIPIIIENDDGSETKYILRKLNGGMRSTYLNNARKKLDINGSVAVQRDFTGQFSDLLCLCLHKTDASGAPLPVPMTAKEVDSIDGDVLGEIFKKAVEVNGLTEKTEEAEKKD